jgi:hypothetical protein
MILVKTFSSLGMIMTTASGILADCHKLGNLCKDLVVNP